MATQLFQVVGKDQINRFKISIKISFQFQYLQYFQKNLFLHQFSFVNRRETNCGTIWSGTLSDQHHGSKKRFCWKTIKFCFFPVFFLTWNVKLYVFSASALHNWTRWEDLRSEVQAQWQLQVEPRECVCVWECVRVCVCVCLCEKLQRRHLAPLDLMV